jgi:hypothetical protein
VVAVSQQAPAPLPAQSAPPFTVNVNFVENGPLEMEIDEWFTVIRVQPGGRADQNGVRVGYKMVAFNGIPTGSDSLGTCMNKVRVTPRPWIFTFQVPIVNEVKHAGGVEQKPVSPSSKLSTSISSDSIPIVHV